MRGVETKTHMLFPVTLDRDRGWELRLQVVPFESTRHLLVVVPVSMPPCFHHVHDLPRQASLHQRTVSILRELSQQKVKAESEGRIVRGLERLRYTHLEVPGFEVLGRVVDRGELHRA
eukprot:3235814-Rhodomonas_salina.2